MKNNRWNNPGSRVEESQKRPKFIIRPKWPNRQKLSLKKRKQYTVSVGSEAVLKMETGFPIKEA